MMQQYPPDRKDWRYVVALALVCATIVASLWSTSACADNPYKRDYIASAKAMEWKYELERGLVVATCETESRWNPDAESEKGALGLCQIMPEQFDRLIMIFQAENGLEVDGQIGPATWEAFRPGVPFKRMTNRERLLDPYQNVEWAAYYLKWIEINVSSNPVIMMAVYYAGQFHQVVKYVRLVNEKLERNHESMSALP